MSEHPAFIDIRAIQAELGERDELVGIWCQTGLDLAFLPGIHDRYPPQGKEVHLGVQVRRWGRAEAVGGDGATPYLACQDLLAALKRRKLKQIR